MSTIRANTGCGCGLLPEDLFPPIDPNTGRPIVRQPGNRAPSRPIEPGNSLRTALNTGRFPARRTFVRADSTNRGDADLYKVTITQASRFAITVTNLSPGRAIVGSLLNSRGQVVRGQGGNLLTATLNRGSSTFSETAPVGTYYLRVIGQTAANASYRLSLRF